MHLMSAPAKYASQDNRRTVGKKRVPGDEAAFLRRPAGSQATLSFVDAQKIPCSVKRSLGNVCYIFCLRRTIEEFSCSSLVPWWPLLFFHDRSHDDDLSWTYAGHRKGPSSITPANQRYCVPLRGLFQRRNAIPRNTCRTWGPPCRGVGSVLPV